jgi:hypothetical protein
MPTLTKDQVRQIIQNAPKGTSPAGIVAALRQKGYQLEAFDQKEPGFIDRAKADIANRQENINEISKRTQSNLSTNFQIIGQGFGAGADVLGELRKTIYNNLVPKFVRDTVSNIGESVVENVGNATIAGEGTPTVSELITQLKDRYKDFSQDNPEAAGNIEALGNIFRAASEVYGAGKSVQVATDVTKAGIKSAQHIVQTVQNKSAQNLTDDIVELTRPVLSKADKKAALAAGQGKQTGILRTIDIEPSARDLEVAEAAKSVINPSKSAVENIASLNKEIAVSANNLKKSLASNNAIFNTKQLRKYVSSAIDSAERQVLLAGDEAAEKAYKGVVNTFMSVVAKHPKNLTGLLAARKEFDRIAEKGLKGVFSEGVITARKQAIRDIRRKANEYIADQLPAGDAMREVLRRQSLLFDAVDNISDKTVENVGTNIVTRTAKKIRQHPIASTAAGAAAGAATVGTILNR